MTPSGSGDQVQPPEGLGHMDEHDWRALVDHELRATVERFTALAFRMADAVAGQGDAPSGVMVTAVDGVPLETPQPFPAERSDQVEDLAEGLRALAQMSQILLDPQRALSEQLAKIGQLFRSCAGLSRLASDTLSGRDYQPRGPVPTGGFSNLERRMERASALLNMSPTGEFPSFVRLLEDFDGRVQGGGVEHFSAGVLYVVEERNDRGSIRLLDDLGRATWVPKDHPYQLVGPRRS